MNLGKMFSGALFKNACPTTKFPLLFLAALNPRWNETFTFNINVPDLALIRFVLEDQMALTANDFLGQFTLPVMSLNKGKIKQGWEESACTHIIFVHAWVSLFIVEFETILHMCSLCSDTAALLLEWLQSSRLG